MKRVERLRIFQLAIEDIERRRAATLAARERQLTSSAAKLAELEVHSETYARHLNARAGAPLGAAGLSDCHTFLALLRAAVRQQASLVTRARTERDAERLSWKDAAQRVEVVGRLISRWKNEEYGLGNHCTQRNSADRLRRHSIREHAAYGA